MQYRCYLESITYQMIISISEANLTANKMMSDSFETVLGVL